MILLWSPALLAQVSTAWVTRYDGPAAAGDQAADIAVDAAGNLFVTGSSDGTGAGYATNDFATVRIDAQGQVVWSRRYDGPQGGQDEAKAIALDGSGNVIVAGISQGTSSSATAFAVAICKYSSAGVLSWARRYEVSSGGLEGLAGMAVDRAGNVFVTGNVGHGSSGGSTDIFTAAYDPAGQLKWSVEYDGPAADWDSAMDLVVDRAGNVIVVGFASGVGTIWDCAVLKYTPSGSLSWVALYDGEALQDQGVAAAVDSSGRIFVAGSTRTTGANGEDLLVLAYGSSGNVLWTRAVDLPSTQEARAIALGPSNDVFVAARSGDPTPYTNTDVLVLRLGPDGDVLWSASHAGAPRSEPVDLLVDAAGNANVTGISYGNCNHFGCDPNYLTLKFDAGGELDWVVAFNGPYSPPPFSFCWDIPSALALGPSGSVFVTGSSQGVAGTLDFTTIRYDQAPLPVVYCSSKPSSLPGCSPSLGSASALASLVAGAGTCDVTCAPVPGGTQSAIAIASTGGALVAPVASTFGWLCIQSGPAWFRLPAALPGGTSSHCDGMYVFDVGGWLAAQAGNPALAAGGTLDLQVWYRDPPNPGGANLSNALALDLVP